MPSEHPEDNKRQIEAWLEAARQGSSSSLGQLLDTCRNYLLLVANQTLDAQLQGKVAPSDLVQETFLQAQNHFQDFAGHSEEELLAWLRRIVVNQAYDAQRRFAALKREADRETNQSPAHLAGPVDSPSAQAAAGEQQAALARAMACLPDDYRRVVELRNWERKSFEEIGVALGRSAEAARKLWARAIEKLQELLHES
jgi:RNA polymerase sigma-70 factor (ECF subfamily)